jgi:hypothetical protein
VSKYIRGVVLLQCTALHYNTPYSTAQPCDAVTLVLSYAVLICKKIICRPRSQAVAKDVSINMT